MNKFKIYKYWMIFFMIMGTLAFFGVFFLLNSSEEGFRFIYENMIWFPIEITILIIVINKLLNGLEKRKEEERFRRVTKRPTETIIFSLKNNIVDIIHDRSIYDRNRPDTNQLYKEIIKNMDLFVTDQLLLSTKSYSFNPSSKMRLNIIGILHVECKKLDNDLKKYIDRFHVFFDDDVYLGITELEKNNHNLGLLNYPLSMNGGNANTHQMGGDLEYTKSKIKEHISKTNEFIELLDRKLN